MWSETVGCRSDPSHQFGLTSNFFERFNSDVSLVEADAYLLAVDLHSLAETECWNAEIIQYEKKLGQFCRMTYHVEPSTIVEHLNKNALGRPRSVDCHHPDVKWLLKYNPRWPLSGLLEFHHHAKLSFLTGYPSLELACTLSW